MTIRVGRARALGLMGGALCFVLAAAPATAQCVGDCNGNNMVEINELILGVNIALGLQPVSACEAFANAQHMVDIAQLIRGVNNALNGCPPLSTPTSTGTPVGTATATVTPTPTPTRTGSPACPLVAGSYTVTQTAGGALSVYGFQPFPFPEGGTIIEDVAAASLPDCVHDVVVPFPGGFSAPSFCVPALGFTTLVTQTACGIGKLDSNGGSDFDTNEIADTSDSSATCNLPQAGCTQGADSHLRVDMTVGNGTADSCLTADGMNAIVTVPVHTKSWIDSSPGVFCNDAGDGVFNDDDSVVAEFNQILDFTTATAKGKWMDLDGDVCFIAGLGPPSGYTDTGTCIDPSKVNSGQPAVITIATGEFGSTGGTFDGSFSTKLPNRIDGPAAPLGATCSPAPVINYGGSVTRCIP